MGKNIENAKKYFLQGLEKYNDEDYEEAEKFFHLSLKIIPERVSILLNLSATQIKLKKLNEAKKNLETILSIEPKNTLALMNIANIYLENRLFEKAHDYLDLAIKNEKDNHELLCNKGSLYRFTGDLENALKFYDKALLIKKNYSFAKFNKSICELSLENFENGWINYEYRECRYDEEVVEIKEPFKFENITILSEQGIGDVIMFGSLLPLLKNFRNINFHIDERLLEIFTTSFPQINFYSQANFISETDQNYQIKIGSLARFFIKNINDFNKINKPFLKPIEAKQNEIKQYIKKDKINIGIYWSSSSKQQGKITKIKLIDIIKNINLHGKNIISIQDGNFDNELNEVTESLDISLTKIKNFNLKNDLSHLSTLISQCDLIISISSTVIHLAGALGIPTIVLCQFAPDWRYFKSTNKLLWYSKTNLLKQERLDDWSKPLILLNSEIDKILKS